MTLNEKVAVVTGGLSGIGEAVAARFAAEGATVVAADIAATATAFDGAGPIHPFRLDVTDEASNQALATAVHDRFGRLDCLVNCAGIGKDVAFLKTLPGEFDRIMAVNVRGTFLVGQACAEVMVRRGSGAIVNIASVAGLRASLGRAAYGASKAAVVMLSQVMAVELASHGVRVNILAPGPVDTPMVRAMADPAMQAAWFHQIPMGRYGQPKEIAAAALYLCSDEASFVTGEVLTIDGGYAAGGIVRR